jgi:acyl-CoA hydrolase
LIHLFFFKIIKNEWRFTRIIKNKKMRFHTRKWIKPEDLNPNGTLFGGQLLAWIDEGLYSIIN